MMDNVWNIWHTLTDNWQTTLSVICVYALGYLHAKWNARERIDNLENENDRLKWVNHILRRLLHKEDDNEVSK